MEKFRVIDLGVIDYDLAFRRQKDVVSEVVSGAGSSLILCEHPNTITLGRKYKEQNLFRSRADLIEHGFKIEEVDRGGDVTLHAPGQLVVYPVINLKEAGLGLKAYLNKLEQVAVDLLAEFGIVASGDDGNRGVWVGNRKLASIGIGVSRWVTYHGMGINLNTDLSLFKVIRPCGLDVKMTSVGVETGRLVDVAAVKRLLVKHFKRIFGYT